MLDNLNPLVRVEWHPPLPSPCPEHLPPTLMHLDKKFLQRAFLAFTAGLFLACAARLSSASAAEPKASVSTSR